MIEGALVLTGPTASGKSSLAIELSQHVDMEIISADSVQVYRGMNIGTAKPPLNILESVPHHLLDIRQPTETYSAAEFRQDILKLVPEIRGRGRLPVIVGGTMLYLKLLKQGLAELPKPLVGLDSLALLFTGPGITMKVYQPEQNSMTWKRTGWMVRLSNL